MTTCSVQVNGCAIYHPYSPTEDQEDRACRLMNCKLSFRLPCDGPTQAFPLPFFPFYILENLLLKKITILLGPRSLLLGRGDHSEMKITLLILCYAEGCGVPGVWVKSLMSKYNAQGERCDGLARQAAGLQYRLTIGAKWWARDLKNRIKRFLLLISSLPLYTS